MSETRVDPKQLPGWRRLLTAVETEFAGVHPTLHAYSVAARLLPLRSAGLARGRLLRLAGFNVGEQTSVNGPLKISGPRGLTRQLAIGREVTIDADCMLDLSDKLTIGDRVTLGAGVMILTSTHELDFPKHRAGRVQLNPVVIGDGAWLRPRCIILPGVTIGAGAIVEVGAVVNKDVAPNARVGGSPATQLEILDGPHER
jgi:acetyltransferase-like isoleucine patch superfamily enzyme